MPDVLTTAGGCLLKNRAVHFSNTRRSHVLKCGSKLYACLQGGKNSAKVHAFFFTLLFLHHAAMLPPGLVCQYIEPLADFSNLKVCVR